MVEAVQGVDPQDHRVEGITEVVVGTVDPTIMEGIMEGIMEIEEM